MSTAENPIYTLARKKLSSLGMKGTRSTAEAVHLFMLQTWALTREAASLFASH
jgi:hypothetical protein